MVDIASGMKQDKISQILFELLNRFLIFWIIYLVYQFIGVFLQVIKHSVLKASL